jgi:superfamily II DNA/RNA helicase
MSFNKFNLDDRILTVLESQGYVSPTPIQQQTINPILSGKDVLGLAQTGTGKTAAFALPLLQRLSHNKQGSSKQALILSPTRELADQTAAFIQQFCGRLNLSCIVIYGGVSRNNQVNQLKKGADILVACPGRLLDLIGTGEADISQVDALVLDEADQMMDKGFLPDIRKILSRLPNQRQNLVFSATMPKEVSVLVENLLNNPERVSIGHKKPKGSIGHTFYHIDDPGKKDLLSSLLQEEGTDRAIVFTRTKFKAKKLAHQLSRVGVKASSLQGNLSQNKRQEALSGFRDGRYTVLVATDIAARGIDVTGVTHVINFDMPDTVDAYTHRTGRTGRADFSGQAITFAAGGDSRMVKRLTAHLKGKVDFHSVSTDAPRQGMNTGTSAGESTQKISGNRRRKSKRSSKSINTRQSV